MRKRRKIESDDDGDEDYKPPNVKQDVETTEKQPIKVEAEDPTDDVATKLQENEVNEEAKEEKNNPEKKFEMDEKEKALWDQISSRFSYFQHIFYEVSYSFTFTLLSIVNGFLTLMSVLYFACHCIGTF